MKVTHWYFVVTESDGHESIVSYGDSSKYTLDQAVEKMVQKYGGDFRIATEEDMNHLL